MGCKGEAAARGDEAREDDGGGMPSGRSEDGGPPSARGETNQESKADDALGSDGDDVVNSEAEICGAGCT